MLKRQILAINKTIIIALNDDDDGISQMLNIPRASIDRVVHQCEEFGTVERRPISRRSLVLFTMAIHVLEDLREYQLYLHGTELHVSIGHRGV